MESRRDLGYSGISCNKTASLIFEGVGKDADQRNLTTLVLQAKADIRAEMNQLQAGSKHAFRNLEELALSTDPDKALLRRLNCLKNDLDAGKDQIIESWEMTQKIMRLLEKSVAEVNLDDLCRSFVGFERLEHDSFVWINHFPTKNAAFGQFRMIWFLGTMNGCGEQRWSSRFWRGSRPRRACGCGRFPISSFPRRLQSAASHLWRAMIRRNCSRSCCPSCSGFCRKNCTTTPPGCVSPRFPCNILCLTQIRKMTKGKSLFEMLMNSQEFAKHTVGLSRDALVKSVAIASHAMDVLGKIAARLDVCRLGVGVPGNPVSSATRGFTYFANAVKVVIGDAVWKSGILQKKFWLYTDLVSSMQPAVLTQTLERCDKILLVHDRRGMIRMLPTPDHISSIKFALIFCGRCVESIGQALLPRRETQSFGVGSARRGRIHEHHEVRKISVGRNEPAPRRVVYRIVDSHEHRGTAQLVLVVISGPA